MRPRTFPDVWFTSRGAAALSRRCGSLNHGSGGTTMVIQSPPAWGWDQLRIAAHEIGSARPEEYWHEAAASAAPTVRRIGLVDLKDALARGIDDFEANRTDVIFLCVIYPIIGLVL